MRVDYIYMQLDGVKALLFKNITCRQGIVQDYDFSVEVKSSGDVDLTSLIL